MASRLLFLCARGSSRALLAASILAALAERHWDVWSTPTQDEQGRVLAEQVLYEQGIPLLASDHFIEPTFGMKALSCAAVLPGPDRSFLVPVGISSGRWKIRHHLILRSKSKSRRTVVSVTPWCERSE